MEKFVLVNEQATTASIGDAAHDVACFPVSNFLGFTDETTDSTKLTLMFKPMEESIGSDPDGCDNVVLTITDNAQVTVMKEIIQKFNSSRATEDGVIVLGDAETGEFLSSNITAVEVNIQTAA
tara:strand:+ start:470 stop:838 length:369 start_codon:yes stop_codon:yes gene_type:complete